MQASSQCAEEVGSLPSAADGRSERAASPPLLYAVGARGSVRYRTKDFAQPNAFLARNTPTPRGINAVITAIAVSCSDSPASVASATAPASMADCSIQITPVHAVTRRAMEITAPTINPTCMHTTTYTYDHHRDENTINTTTVVRTR